MPEQPKISIIIPIYNMSLYLSRCLDSVITQTHTNLEIILIDDGSTDDSLAICQDYANCDSRIIVIRKPNGGVSTARNAGLDIATGEWIGFVDPDDYINPKMYEILLNLNEPWRPIRCTGAVELWDEGHAGAAVWSKLYWTQHIKDLRFDEDLLTSQDMLFVIQAGTEWTYTPEHLYHYQNREGSAVNSFNARRMTSLLAWDRILGIKPTYRKHYAHSLVNLLHNATYYQANEYIRPLQKKALKHISYNLNLRGVAITCFPKTTLAIYKKIQKIK